MNKSIYFQYIETAKGKHFREEALLEKRSCVCQNRWQLVKRIRCCYYCLQRHFRLINHPPQKHRQTHTHDSHRPPTVSLIPTQKPSQHSTLCHIYTVLFLENQTAGIRASLNVHNHCPKLFSKATLFERLQGLKTTVYFNCFIFGSLKIYYKTKKLIKKAFLKGVKQGVGHYGHSGRGVNSFPPCRHVIKVTWIEG